MDQEELGAVRIAPGGPLSRRQRSQPGVPSADVEDGAEPLPAVAGGAVSLALFALDVRHVPAAFLDNGGRVFALNRRALALLGTGLRVNNGRLFCDDRHSDAELRRIVGVLATPAGSSLIEAAPIMVTRPGKRSLLVEILPTARACPEVGSLVVALVVITDLEQQTSVSEGLLRNAFGLTSAEARLAKSLGEGNDLQAASGLLGIASGTARTQLKAVFAKTQTRRQSELISFLYRIQSSRLPEAACVKRPAPAPPSFRLRREAYEPAEGGP